jgi:hypothetical protein
VEALSTLLNTHFVSNIAYLDFLKRAVQQANFEVIALFSHPQIIHQLKSNKNFSPEMILKKGLEKCPMLDIAETLSQTETEIISIYQLFFPSDNPSEEQIKTRLAEMFVLNSIESIESCVQKYIEGKVSPNILAIINDEIASFKEIGTLVARSRLFTFYVTISKSYHPNNVASAIESAASGETYFTKFAKGQVAYGRYLLQQVQSAPNDYSLLQLYGHFSRKRETTRFLTERSVLTTAIVGRYTPFLDNIGETKANMPSSGVVRTINDSAADFPIDNETITFTTFTPTKPKKQVLLTSIKTSSSNNKNVDCYTFYHSKVVEMKKYLPYHIREYERLKKPVEIRTKKEFRKLVDSIAAFIWHNSHLCLTDRGNAQITINIMQKLFDIHGIEVGPTKIDVTFIDCKALSMTIFLFVFKFRSFFVQPPH